MLGEKREALTALYRLRKKDFVSKHFKATEHELKSKLLPVYEAYKSAEGKWEAEAKTLNVNTHRIDSSEDVFDAERVAADLRGAGETSDVGMRLKVAEQLVHLDAPLAEAEVCPALAFTPERCGALLG